jgi:hypothetical protein
MKDYAKAARLKRDMHGSKLSADEWRRVRAMDELNEDLKKYCDNIDEGLIGDDAWVNTPVLTNADPTPEVYKQPVTISKDKLTEFSSLAFGEDDGEMIQYKLRMKVLKNFSPELPVQQQQQRPAMQILRHEQKQPVKAKVLPISLTKMFGQIGFMQWGKNHLPALIVNPFMVDEEREARKTWILEFLKVH